MAKVYRAPIDPPDLSYLSGDWRKTEKEYLEKLRNEALKNKTGGTNDNLIGEIVRYPVADGYAQYMVWRTRPLELIWIELGDAWDFRYVDKMNLTDIKKEVEAERTLARIFGK